MAFRHFAGFLAVAEAPISPVPPGGGSEVTAWRSVRPMRRQRLRAYKAAVVASMNGRCPYSTNSSWLPKGSRKYCTRRPAHGPSRMTIGPSMRGNPRCRRNSMAASRSRTLKAIWPKPGSQLRGRWVARSSGRRAGGGIHARRRDRAGRVRCHRRCCNKRQKRHPYRSR